jgi:ATP synthase protein I
VEIGLVFRQAALKVLRLQLLIGTASIIVWMLVDGMAAGLAALIGLGISAMMTASVALRWSLSGMNNSPRALLGGFYRAEMMKLLLGSGLIFVGVYVFRDQAFALVSTLAVTLLAYGFVLLTDIDQTLTKQD